MNTKPFVYILVISIVLLNGYIIIEKTNNEIKPLLVLQEQKCELMNGKIVMVHERRFFSEVVFERCILNENEYFNLLIEAR